MSKPRRTTQGRESQSGQAGSGTREQGARGGPSAKVEPPRAAANAHVIRLPELLQRIEDIGLISRAVLEQLRDDGAHKILFRPRAVQALVDYRWPLNSRELGNVLQRAVALAKGEDVGPEHLPENVTSSPRPADKSAPAAEDPRHAQLVALLREHQGNVSAVARAMGKVRSQVQRWIKRYGLDPTDYRPGNNVAEDMVVEPSDDD